MEWLALPVEEPILRRRSDYFWASNNPYQRNDKVFIRAWRLLNKAIGVHPAGALAGFAVALVLVSLSFVVRSGIERRETSLVVDSISHVCDSLRNGDRYEAGYADGVKAMRNRKIESGL